MPRPIDLKIVLKVLRKNGFVLVFQKSSHAKYKKIDSRSTKIVIVKTTKKQIPHGTFQSILQQSGLQEADFLK